MKTILTFALAICLIPLFSSKANAGHCREGTEEVFLEDDGSGEHLTPVHYVCQNGELAPMYGASRNYDSTGFTSCREGSSEILLEDDGSGEFMVPVRYVCRNGRFHSVNDPRRNGYRSHHRHFRGHRSCQEGAREIFLERIRGTDDMEPVHYICHSGRYVREFPRRR
jgi:hypothetical protein